MQLICYTERVLGGLIVFVDFFEWLKNIGITSAFVSALVSTLIVEFYKKNKDLDNEKKIKEIEHKYEVELTKLQIKTDTLTFISNTQYEKEFQIYMEVWEAMDECIRYTNMLYPQFEYAPSKSDKEEYLKFCQDKYEKFATAYNTYLKCMKKYEPFYEEKICENFSNLLSVCCEVGDIFRDEEIMKYTSPTFMFVQNEPMLKEDKQFVRKDSKEQIKELRQELKHDIKDYLNNLKTKFN